jgi:di/tricarboxylate transporter
MLPSGRTKGEEMQRIRRLVIILLATALSFMPATAGAVSKHSNLRPTAEVCASSFANVVGFLAQFSLPVSEPTGLIIMGLLLIGLSVVVRKAAPGKRGR